MVASWTSLDRRFVSERRCLRVSAHSRRCVILDASRRSLVALEILL